MDALTKCLLRADLDQEWLEKQVKKHDYNVCSISFDCDSLVQLTGWLGFAASDQKLIDVSNGLKALLPECDIVRSGGDEFLAVAARHCINEESLDEILKSLVDEEVYDVVRRSPSYQNGNSGIMPPPIAFTVSCCAASFQPPHDLANMDEVDRANVERIAMGRHDGQYNVTPDGDQRLVSLALIAE